MGTEIKGPCRLGWPGYLCPTLSPTPTSSGSGAGTRPEDFDWVQDGSQRGTARGGCSANKEPKENTLFLQVLVPKVGSGRMTSPVHVLCAGTSSQVHPLLYYPRREPLGRQPHQRLRGPACPWPPRTDFHIHAGLWVIKICTILGEDVDNGGGCACAGAGSKWGNSGPSSQFCCEPKTALQKVSNVNKSTRLVQK